MSSLKKRAIEFDILRSIVIIGSIILHFDTNFNIRALSFPFSFVQNNLFTVGTFFFFTAGVMAYRVYIPRYRSLSSNVSLTIARKGLIILAIYFTHITVMRLVTNTGFPDGVLSYIFKHPFFLKVLFSFGILYITMPFVLLPIYRNEKMMFVFPILLYFVIIVSPEFLKLPEWVIMIFIDRSKFLYALFPCYVVFFIGMLFGRYSGETDSETKIAMFLNSGVTLTIFVFYVFLLGINSLFFKFSVHNLALIAPLREALTLCFSVILCKRSITYFRFLYRLLSNNKLLCFGIESLTTYVTGNVLIGLMIYYSSDDLVAKTFILCSILFFTYSVANWKRDSRILHARIAQNPR